MIKSLRNNPILAQQMRHARWPSMRTAVLIAAGLMVIGLALIITAYALYPDGSMLSISSPIVVIIELLLLAFGPLLTAVIAVVATIRAIDTEAYQMMRLSELSERDIVNGYLAGAVFRLRSLWMIAGGLVLPLLTALTHIFVVIIIYFSCGGLVDFDPTCTPPTPAEILLQQAGIALIATLYYVILFIAWNWLATTLGVWMAFRLRRTGRALVGALLPVVIIILLHIAMLFVVSWSWELLVVIMMFAGADLVLGWAAHRQAVKCVNRPIERPVT